MGLMHQQTIGLNLSIRRTRKAVFLDEMNPSGAVDRGVVADCATYTTRQDRTSTD